MAIVSRLTPISDRLFTTNFGSLLFLKACGFVEENRAQILDVTEDSLKVRIGGTWLERLFFHCSSHQPVEVTLNIRRDQECSLSPEERMRLPGISCSQIDVTITPRSRVWSESEFKKFSRRMLWSLRQHFLSP